MQQSRFGPTTQSTASQSREPGPGGSSPVVQLMRGMPLAQQLEALAPRENARPEGGASPVQMKIDAGTLNAKLESDSAYNGTIDTDTDCATANAVGEEWVGGGAARQKYGPPFGFQLLSADGTRQYRPPMVKQQSKNSGQAQANYEARTGKGKHFTFNAHVTVNDIANYQQQTQ